MSPKIIVAKSIWAGLVLYAQRGQSVVLPTRYDTIWTTQSNNSAGSMPLGGSSVGLNVWAESGDILLYIAHSAAFDENDSLLKLGRVRLSLDPNPFAVNATKFEQRLHLNDGYMTLSGDDDTYMKLWVDVETSGIHVDVNSHELLNMTASFESWRTTGWQMKNGEQRQTSWGTIDVKAIPLPWQYPDDISFASNGVLNYHHNSDTPLFNFQVAEQNLSRVQPESFFNPMTNNTFGTFMTSPQLRPGTITKGIYQRTNFTAYNLVPRRLSKTYQIYIATGQEQTTDVNGWISDLIRSARRMRFASQKSTTSWWNSFWDRSHIIINPDAPSTDPGFQVGKNYQYFRYMMACNAGGKFPTRFNGGLFTFDPVLTSTGAPWSPDYRAWSGGTFTAQNQRLLYWPLLRSGDFDILRQGLDFYKNISPNNRKLGQLYFGLDVGLTSEQIDNTGLPNVYEYDAKLFDGDGPRASLYPPGILYNDYLSWLSDTANEFADMALLAHIYDQNMDIEPYMPFVEYQLAWFDEYYQMRNGLDSNGSLIIYPASGAETYKLAFNPSSTVSGLRRIITDILRMDLPLVKGNKTYYEGATGMISPGTWGEYGLGQPTDLSIALHTYFNDSQSAGYHNTYGWRQDQIWFARLGLTEQAKANTEDRFSDSTKFRFPTFKGPNYDWPPDINHYGSAAIGLQEMLMQTFARNNTQIRLLPAWPEDWTGSFKLLAPYGTTVQGKMAGADGITGLVVEPESRIRDVMYGKD
ncbi:Six-hairpin glycosidase-like protein [Aspergillus falconensis]